LLKHSSKKIQNHLLGFILLYTLFYYGWLYLFRENNALKIVGGDLLSFFAPFIASIWLFLIVKKTKNRGNYFWLFLFFGTLSLCIAEGIWDYYELILKRGVPFPGWADLFYILQIVFYLFAFLYKLYEKKESYSMLRFLFDIVIIMIVTTTLSWRFILQDIFTDPSLTNTALLVSAAYPIGDLVLIFGAVSMLLSSNEILPKKVLLFISAGLFFQIFADIAYMYLIAGELYESGSLLDPLWPLAGMLIGLSGFYSSEEDSKNKKKQNSSIHKNQLGIKRQLIPYAAIIILLSIWYVEQSSADSLLIGLLLSSLLVLIRQVITIIQNNSLLLQLQHLNEELEEKVSDRTKELSVKNKQLTRMIKHMEHIAYHDGLTGLPNRRMFEAKLTEAIKKAEKEKNLAAVLFIDLDRFKNINDTFGHGFGDLLIRNVAQRLRKGVENRFIVSRQGGDEFTILLDSVSSIEYVQQIAERISKLSQKSFLIEEQEIRTSFSIGIAIYPMDGENVESLLKNADAAMYRTKELGKNNYTFYHNEMNELMSNKVMLEHELYKAIENEEFIIHYQPQVNMETGKIKGVEALIRWNHPKIGMISPQDFIPVAEETGLIIPIQNWLMENVCYQLKEWQQKGFPSLKAGINLSPRQLQEGHFIRELQNCFEKTGVSPEFLNVEITESIAMNYANEVMLKLEQLKDLGIEISIDDFGTGYSSLAYLKYLPIHTIKIAREFIRDLNKESSDEAIVVTIIEMAKQLHLNVIAEGVETVEQLLFLKQHDCLIIQGFLYSKPLPADVFERQFLNVTESQNTLYL
jgi:diguanylate cyclase